MDIAARADLWIGVSLLRTPQSDATPGLSPAGIAIMVVSIGAILTLVVWCYARLLFGRRRQHGED